MPAEKASFKINRITSAMRTPITLQKSSDSLRSGDLAKKRDLAKKLTPAARRMGNTNERTWRIANSKDSCQWRMIISLAPFPSVRATMDPIKKSQLTEKLGIKKNKAPPGGEGAGMENDENVDADNLADADGADVDQDDYTNDVDNDGNDDDY